MRTSKLISDVVFDTLDFRLLLYTRRTSTVNLETAQKQDVRKTKTTGTTQLGQGLGPFSPPLLPLSPPPTPFPPSPLVPPPSSFLSLPSSLTKRAACAVSGSTSSSLSGAPWRRRRPTTPKEERVQQRTVEQIVHSPVQQVVIPQERNPERIMEQAVPVPQDMNGTEIGHVAPAPAITLRRLLQ